MRAVALAFLFALTACVTPQTKIAASHSVDFKHFKTVSFAVHDAASTEYGENRGYGVALIKELPPYLSLKLEDMGYTVVQDGADFSIDVTVTAAKPGNSAARFLVGFGAGRAVMTYHAEFRTETQGTFASFEGGRSYTGMELNVAAFPNEQELQFQAISRTVEQIEKFIRNGGDFPPDDRSLHARRD